MCGTTGTDVLYIDYRCTDNLLDSLCEKVLSVLFSFFTSLLRNYCQVFSPTLVELVSLTLTVVNLLLSHLSLM